jgi:hypothetical protein
VRVFAHATHPAVQNFYPERLGCCLLLNAPAVFKLLWTAIKRVLSPRTADKIVFLGGDYKEKLLLYFDAAQIPQARDFQYAQLNVTHNRHR